MKKLSIFGITTLALVFAVAFSGISFAGEGCSASKTAVKKANVIKTGEQYAKDCNYEGKCEVVNINVEGMTCTGCENSLTTALTKVEGVVKVVSVDHKTGKAVVCYDPDKTKDAVLTSTITKKGYKADIIPAVATTVDAKAAPANAKGCGTMDKKSCAATCGTKAAAACASKGKTTADATTTKVKAEGTK